MSPLAMLRLSAAYAAVTLCTMSDAKRLFLISGKQRADAVVQQTALNSITEAKLVGLDNEARQMESDILDVQNHLQASLVLLESLAGITPTNATKATNATKQVVAMQSVKLTTKEGTKNTGKKTIADAKASKEGTKNTGKKTIVDAKVSMKVEESVLENLFKHMKSNIARFNKQESEDKRESQKHIAKLQARVAKDKADLQKKGLTGFQHDLLVNRTRMDESELKYSLNDRNLGHEVFHANLKMTHGLMSRVKMMVGAFKDAATTGHVDKHLLAKIESQALPKSFAQMREDVQHSIQLYRTHLESGARSAP